MPLYKRQAYALQLALPEGLAPDAEVFVARSTGEVFETYESYVEAVNRYRSRVWSCVYSGKGSLTYEEALACEAKQNALLKKFPNELEEAVARAAHHSTLRIDDLVTQLHSENKERATGDKEKENAGGASQAKGGDKAKGAGQGPLSKSVIRRYLQEVTTRKGGSATGKGAFVVNPELVEKYGLPAELPADLAAVVKANTRAAPGPKVFKPRTPTKAEKIKADKPKVEKEPMKITEEPYPRTLEEDKARFKQGTIKWAMLKVMEAAGVEGMKIKAVGETIKEQNVLGREWKDGIARSIVAFLCQDDAFTRIGSGTYALSALPGVKGWRCPPKEAKEKEEDPVKAAVKAATKAVAETEPTPSDPLEAAESAKRVADAAVAAAKKIHAAADAAMAAARKASEAAASKGGKGGEGDGAAEATDEELLKGCPHKLDEEWEEYKGDVNDRKALMAWRKDAAMHKKRVDTRRRWWLIDTKKERAAAAKAAAGGLSAAASKLSAAQKALAAAEKTAAVAAARVTGLQMKEKLKAEREAQREADAKERERRRAEALAAKRYPIDDLQLVDELREAAKKEGKEPPADLPLPRWLPEEEGDLSAELLAVADFLCQFGKALGLRHVHYAELRGLVGLDAYGEGEDADDRVSKLGELFESLLQAVLEDLLEDEEGGLESRWLDVLGAATWPDVLRRYVLHRATEAYRVAAVTPAMAEAAASLGSIEPGALPPAAAGQLLRLLTDELLDSETVRGVLEKRTEDAENVTREVRAEVAEERRKLKEIVEAEREERKRKREDERLALLASIESQAAAAKEGKEGAGEKEGAEDDGPPAKKVKKDPVEEETPSFELPPEFESYTGDDGDRKAMLEWRQQKQAKQRELEKAKKVWEEERATRQREAEAEKKAAAEAEKRLARKKENLEEKMEALREKGEERLERVQIRRAPLGKDRAHRTYWWGLGHDRAALYVHDPERNAWGAHEEVGGLDGLMEVLDGRGRRERDLKGALEKRYLALSRGLARGRPAADAEKPKDRFRPRPAHARTQPARASSRATKQVEFYDPTKEEERSRRQDSPDSVPDAAQHGGSALADGATAIAEVARAAAAAKLPLDGAGSWASKANTMKELEEMWDSDAGEAGVATLRAAALDIEDALFKALDADRLGVLISEPGSPSEADRDADEAEAMDVDDAIGSPSKRQRHVKRHYTADDVEEWVESDDEAHTAPRPGKRRRGAVWATLRERLSWRKDAAAAATVAHAAYVSLVLRRHALKALEMEKKQAVKERKEKSKEKGGKDQKDKQDDRKRRRSSRL